jgi:lysophospholipase L1-like esterase
MQPPRRASVAARLTLVIGGIVLAASLAEGGLRAAHFDYHVYPTIQFGWPDPTALRDVYRADSELIWVTRDFDDKLAAARQTRTAIVFMGDSCTEFGSYPSKTLERLRSDAPAFATGVKLGVGGWSSEQGLTLLRRDVLALAPKVITIYFGWNDHWVALGPTDPDLTLAHHLLWLADHSRLAALWMKSRMSVSDSIAKRPNRVPLDRYRANMRAMIREADAAGIRVVVITAPSNHVRGQEPEYLKARHVRSLDEVVPLHETYTEATRLAARDNGATLCDAADAFDRAESKRTLFQRDGIHLTDAGDRLMAELLARCIVDAVHR